MATLEPADLDPPTEAEAADEEATERAAAAASVEDISFKDAAKPSDVKPWGRGRMHLPTIHRLRLDQPGTAIQGAINATGFTVVVPGRKVMEAAGGIAKRDKRIVSVQSNHDGAGSRVTFKFRGGVPGYRVRLRKDFIEFLISAPTN
jgi:hypothetical protein